MDGVRGFPSREDGIELTRCAFDGGQPIREDRGGGREDRAKVERAKGAGSGWGVGGGERGKA